MTTKNTSANKTVSIIDPSKVVIVPGFNIRLDNNMNVSSMEETLLADGRIIDPVHLHRNKDKTLKVLRGHRRIRAAQNLLLRDDVSDDIKKSLRETPAIIHEGLSESDQMLLMLDHGNVQGLARTETALAVRRLVMSNPAIREREVIDRLLHPLAMFSGNIHKLAEIPTNPKERDKMLTGWLHGTCGNYILASMKMGPYVWNQFILTQKAKDRLLETLPTGEMEKVEMNCDRVRITALSKAKSEDLGKAGWDVDKGGESFNKLIEQFKAEDAGTAAGGMKSVRPSVTQLRETAIMFASPAIRAGFLAACGDDVSGLAEMDESLVKLNRVMSFLADNREKLKGQFRELVDAVLASNVDTVKTVIDGIVKDQK